MHLLKGSDEVLLAEGARALIERLLDGRARSDVLDEFTGDEYHVADVVMAATTVSMFGDRLIVARNLSRCTTGDLAPLLDYLGDPSPDSVLVLVWDKPVNPGARSNPLPKKLADAVRSAGGEVHDHNVPANAKGKAMWLDDQLRDARVQLDPRARQLLVDQLGDDVSRLGGILTVLDATFGDATVHADDIVPYLGEAGAVPPWDLTDAIDAGDVAGAVRNLQRLLGGGARHPLQVMVSLQTHVERMVRLDGADVRDDKEAAKLLGMKSAFPAKKAMTAGRRLGPAKLRRALTLVAEADIDLRGRSAQDGAAQLEVLVARLAALSGGARAAGGARGRQARPARAATR